MLRIEEALTIAHARGNNILLKDIASALWPHLPVRSARQNLYNLRKKDTRIKSKQMTTLCHILGVTPNYLLGIDDVMPESTDVPVSNSIEIAPSTTTECMTAVYFDTDALRVPPYRLYQLNCKGERHYYIGGLKEGCAELFPSVTTIIRAVAPENKFLTEWKLNLGKEQSEAYTMERARYGTFVHGLLQELVITRRFNLDDIRARLCSYVDREHLPYDFVDAHENEAKEDMLAFATWVLDYDVRPLAVEVSLYHPEYKYAGMLDCVCNMRQLPLSDELKDIEKAKGDDTKIATIREKYAKRIDAIVDFKTTRKEFQDEHAIQLGLYRLMWNATFPDRQITELANVAPKAWSTTVKKQPSYRFEWQTDNDVLTRIPILLQLYSMEPQSERKAVLISGQIDLTQGLERNIEVVPLAELVTRVNDSQKEENSNELF